MALRSRTLPEMDTASWAYADSWAAEDEVIAAARARAVEVGLTPVTPGAGAALRLLAACVGARSIAEVGTGTGVSGLWLVAGMTPDGILTSIDTEPEHQRLAREAFTAAGIAPGRVRLIGGRALDVLPRLTDAGYDLVHCDGSAQEVAAYLEAAARLLRPGGVVVFSGALERGRGRIAEPTDRDPETVAVRGLTRLLREDERWTAALLPAGSGLLAAVLHRNP